MSNVHFTINQIARIFIVLLKQDNKSDAFLPPLARRLGKVFLTSISIGESVDSPPLRMTLRRPIAGRVLVLAGAAFGRMSALLLQVSLPGFDPPQVCSL